MLLGVGLLHLYAVLDSVDGELARLTQRFSLMGLFMEDLSAYVMINAVNLAVGWRLYAEAHLSWPLVLAVVYSSFGRNVMPVARRALLKSLQTRRPPLDLPLEPERAPSPLRNFIQENVVHATNQWMLVSALLALAGYHIVSPLLVATVFAAIITVLVIKEFAGLLMFMNPNRLEYELSKIYRAARLPTESATDGLTLAKFSVL
jgi:phosphatidylglycerophosphate synthase